MSSILKAVIIGLPVFVVGLHTVVRGIRHFHKFPMPSFLADRIDNPLRRKIQPPTKMPLRHGIEPGMTVLEIGPGNGRYTIELARRVGPTGKLVTVDIEPNMIERVTRKAEVEGITNLDARVSNIYDLPFNDGTFDAASMITVIGEIPEPQRAMQEFYRVLTPGGILAFSEILMDPDYPLAATLIRQASQEGFRLKKKLGSFYAYTLVFERKPAAS